MEQGDPGGPKTRGCWCTKEVLLPEESFKSWSTYAHALRATGPRLRDRITARSGDRMEIEEMCARSGQDMKKDLRWWDLICFGVGSVVGAGIFVLTGLEAKTIAGPAVVLSYVVSGVSAMLSVFCYTEFAIEIPVAGGSFAYLRVELGDFVAFIAAGNILFEYVVSGAAVSRSWTSYLATLLNHKPDAFRIIAPRLPENYNHLDPIAVVVILAISSLALFSTKASSRFNLIATVLHLLIIAFIVAAGLTHARVPNLTAHFAPFGARGVFKASAVLFFAYIGFDAVSTMAEETRDPARDIPVGLVGSMSAVTVIYCALALTICLMQRYSDIDADAPFSVAFQAVGMGWAKYVVALGALKGMTTVLLTSAVGQARYLTHIARTHMVTPWLAKVHPRTKTPVRATVAMAFATAVFAFFTELDVLSNLLSISTLFIFALVAIGVLVRRYYVSGVTSDADRNRFLVCLGLILASSVATAAYWALCEKGLVAYCVTVPVWFLATLGMKVSVKEARRPVTWGVPLVPWLPSASIAINVFLLGSIDGMSFVRFTVWSAVLLVYYFLFGLHASYDAAKVAKVATAEAGGGAKALEEGKDTTSSKSRMHEEGQ
ncbi:Cationic amino acid transporter 1 [Acorus gramineus]|uniref:Cationic amino acid transporter 1 n=1 Tax=Acorus gramineus TaxID=55184 RepID=A0AAV9BMR2_ACOGR|nr:Cationic amino acid transporter 1 [Acorus gramineus]